MHAWHAAGSRSPQDAARVGVRRLAAGSVRGTALDLPARKLLTLVQHDRIFSEGSLAWVDAIVWAIAVAWALLLGVFYFAVSWELPGLPAALLLMLVAGAVLGLLIVVMRALLRQATTLRADMDAVI